MDFANPLLEAIQNGAVGGAGRRASGTNQFFNQQGQAAYEAELRAQDAGNFARAAQQGANPVPVAPSQQGGIGGGYNQLLRALTPNQ